MRQSKFQGKQNRAEIESRFLTITAVLITFIGVPAFFSVMKDPTTETVKVYKVDQGRQPASIELHESKYASPETAEKVSTIQIDCQAPTDSQEVASSLVRLTGNNCGEGKEFQVTNQTNGYTASIVMLRNNQYTTDFIDLKEGPNQLEVVVQNENGQAQKKSFIIHRRQPASETK